MICRRCGKECRYGVIEIHDIGSPGVFDKLNNSVIRWVPGEDKDKLISRDKETFEAHEGLGYYCEDCDMLYAEFRHGVDTWSC